MLARFMLQWEATVALARNNRSSLDILGFKILCDMH